MGDYTFFSLNKTFLPSLFSFLFFHTSLRNDLVLAQISATNWKLYKLRRQRKEEKKSFRTLSLLLRRHGTQHAGRGSKSSYFGIWHSLLSMFRMEVFTFDRSLTYSFLHFFCFCFASAGMEHNLVIDLNRPILAFDTLSWVCSWWKFWLDEINNDIIIRQNHKNNQYSLI